MKRLWVMQSQVGPIYLVASEAGLHGVYWRKPDVVPVSSLSDSGEAAAHLRRAVAQLEEYFRGERREFDLPLVVEGTEFQQTVWNRLRRIPYGVTVSYRDIAEQIGKHKAMRAVGTANGRNHFSIVVPCHRVIAADGTLGGYAGGLEVKTRLLEIERTSVR